MSRQRKSKRKSHNNSPQVLAMMLIGAGLLAIGAVSLVLLPRLGANASSSAGQASSPSSIPVQVDFPAPELSLTDLNGGQVSLADFRGQVILVNNWATWCPPCKAEMPTLQAFYEDHQGQDFTIVAIEAGEPAADVSAFARQYGLSFQVWPDPNQKSLTAFRNMSLPNSYVIDKSGQVRLAWSGAINREMLEKYVTPVLEEQ